MADVFTKAKRSQVMSRIRGRGNRDTEIALLTLLRKHRITGWRRHQSLLGRPDFVFGSHRVAVFVDGCFWHGCPQHATMPSQNAKFWKEKLDGNRARDRRVTRELKRRGWHVIRIWEHDLAKRPDRCTQRIIVRLSEEP